jgi:hypothetical protein
VARKRKFHPSIRDDAITPEIKDDAIKQKKKDIFIYPSQLLSI